MNTDPTATGAARPSRAERQKQHVFNSMRTDFWRHEWTKALEIAVQLPLYPGLREDGPGAWWFRDFALDARRKSVTTYSATYSHDSLTLTNSLMLATELDQGLQFLKDYLLAKDEAERQAAERQALRQSALAKLTPAESRAVGLLC